MEEEFCELADWKKNLANFADFANWRIEEENGDSIDFLSLEDYPEGMIDVTDMKFHFGGVGI